MNRSVSVEVRRFAAFAVVGSVFAGCSTQFDRFETGTRIGQLMGASRAETLEARLADAAFRMTEGQTNVEAKVTLAADGATCAGNTCVWSVERRESALDVALGIRPPGPARTWRRDYVVQLQASPIRTQDDLATSVGSRRIVGNG